MVLYRFLKAVHNAYLFVMGRGRQTDGTQRFCLEQAKTNYLLQEMPSLLPILRCEKFKLKHEASLLDHFDDAELAKILFCSLEREIRLGAWQNANHVVRLCRDLDIQQLVWTIFHQTFLEDAFETMVQRQEFQDAIYLVELSEGLATNQLTEKFEEVASTEIYSKFWQTVMSVRATDGSVFEGTCLFDRALSIMLKFSSSIDPLVNTALLNVVEISCIYSEQQFDCLLELAARAGDNEFIDVWTNRFLSYYPESFKAQLHSCIKARKREDTRQYEKLLQNLYSQHPTDRRVIREKLFSIARDNGEERVRLVENLYRIENSRWSYFLFCRELIWAKNFQKLAFILDEKIFFNLAEDHREIIEREFFSASVLCLLSSADEVSDWLGNFPSWFAGFHREELRKLAIKVRRKGGAKLLLHSNFEGSLLHYNHFFGAIFLPILEYAVMKRLDDNCLYIVPGNPLFNGDIENLEQLTDLELYPLSLELYDLVRQSLAFEPLQCNQINLPSYDVFWVAGLEPPTEALAKIDKFLGMRCRSFDVAKEKHEGNVKILIVGREMPSADSIKYAGKSGAARRSVPNLAELSACLTDRGLCSEVVCFEDLSFLDKYQSIKTADVVVMQHGAALTSLYWAEPGTMLLEILPIPALKADKQIATAGYHLSEKQRLSYARIMQETAHSPVSIAEIEFLIEDWLRSRTSSKP